MPGLKREAPGRVTFSANVLVPRRAVLQALPALSEKSAGQGSEEGDHREPPRKGTEPHRKNYRCQEKSDSDEWKRYGQALHEDQGHHHLSAWATRSRPGLPTAKLVPIVCPLEPNDQAVRRLRGLRATDPRFPCGCVRKSSTQSLMSKPVPLKSRARSPTASCRDLLHVSYRCTKRGGRTITR